MIDEELLDLIENDVYRQRAAEIAQELAFAVELPPADAVELFEKCCLPVLGEDGVEMVSGVYGFTGEDTFSVTFMRSFNCCDEDDTTLQFVLAFTFAPNETNAELREQIERAQPQLFEESEAVAEFFERVRRSESYRYLITASDEYTAEVLLEEI